MFDPKVPGFPAQKHPTRFAKNVSEATFAIVELRKETEAPHCHAYPKGKSRCKNICKLDPKDLNKKRNIARVPLPYNYCQAVAVYHALLCDTHLDKATFCVPLVLGLMGVQFDEASSSFSDRESQLILRPENPEDGPPLADVINYYKEEIQRTGASSDETESQAAESTTSQSNGEASAGTPHVSTPTRSSHVCTNKGQDWNGEAKLDFMVANIDFCFGDGSKFTCIAYSTTVGRCKHNLSSYHIEMAQEALKREFGRPPPLSILESLILNLLCDGHRNEHWKKAYYLKWSPSFVGGMVPDHITTGTMGQGSISTPSSFEKGSTSAETDKSPSPSISIRQHRISEQQKPLKKASSDLEDTQQIPERNIPWSKSLEDGTSSSTAPPQFSPHLPERTVHGNPFTPTNTRTQRPLKQSLVFDTALFGSTTPFRASSLPSQAEGFKAAPTPTPSPFSGDKHTRIKTPSQLEQFGFKTRFELLKNPGVLATLSNDTRELLSDLKKIGTGEEVIPQDMRSFLLAHQLGDGLQSKHFTPESPRAHRSSWDAVQAVMKQWHQIHELLDAAWECEKADLFESAWNAEVHSVVLRLALQGERRKETGIWYRDVTTASISHSCLPPPVTGTTRKVNKMVDYAMIIEPSPGLANAISHRLRIRGESSINHTEQGHVLKTPIAVGIETKRSGCDEDSARAQLIVWAAAHFSRLHQLLQASNEGTRKDIPDLPLILAQGHEWKLALARTEGPEEHKMCFMRYVAIGRTDTVLGIYTLIASLQRVGKWVGDVYEAWLRACLSRWKD